MTKLVRVLREGPGGAPRDLETIWRSFLRKFIGLDNRSSAPFLSGDSFKFLSDVVYEGRSFDFPEDLAVSPERSSVIFAQGRPVSNAADELAKYCARGHKFPASTLVIHNCDEIPTKSQMMILANSFKKVYSVNWLGDPARISPLPIGLENRDKRRNGVPRDYAKPLRRGLPPFEKRDINFLVCFSIHTNRVEREEALQWSRQLPGSYVVREPITPRRYRNLVLRSRFVVSPPGNGPDCHRTWEAMYLGAIPVVKKSSWPFRHLQLPVIQVENWQELQNYLEWPLPHRSSDWMRIDYWFGK